MMIVGQRGPVERTLVIAILLMFTGAIVEKFLGPAFGPESPLLRGVWLPAYAAIIVLAFVEARGIARLTVHEWPLLLVLLIVFVGICWSLDPLLTGRRFLALIISTIFGLYLASRFDAETLVRLVVITLWIVALGSFLLGLVSPEFGRMQEHHTGVWNGMFSEKNRLGQMMALFLSFSAFIVISGRGKISGWTGIFLAFLLIALSQSMTSLLAACTVLVGAVILRFAMAGPLMLMLASSAIVAVAIAASLALIFAPDSSLALLGREASFTGRTEIWNDLAPVIRERLWTGYGYGAFWEAENSPALVLRRLLEWDIPSAHNGWLELMLQGGVLLVLAFALHFCLRMTRALAGLWRARGIDAWPFVYLAMFVVFTLSESSILQQNDIVWVLYVAASATLLRRNYYLLVLKTRPESFHLPAPYPGLRARLRHRRASFHDKGSSAATIP
jgi:O-antigen ligase